MVGGLIVSQALTLFTTPVIYLYLDKLSNAFAGWGRSSKIEDDDRNEDEHASVKEAAE
jgi:HAE1 family hydrophobic/amphiphilic exporter-1